MFSPHARASQGAALRPSIWVVLAIGVRDVVAGIVSFMPFAGAVSKAFERRPPTAGGERHATAAPSVCGRSVVGPAGDVSKAPLADRGSPAPHGFGSTFERDLAGASVIPSRRSGGTTGARSFEACPVPRAGSVEPGDLADLRSGRAFRRIADRVGASTPAAGPPPVAGRPAAVLDRSAATADGARKPPIELKASGADDRSVDGPGSRAVGSGCVVGAAGPAVSSSDVASSRRASPDGAVGVSREGASIVGASWSCNLRGGWPTRAVPSSRASSDHRRCSPRPRRKSAMSRRLVRPRLVCRIARKGRGGRLLSTGAPLAGRGPAVVMSGVSVERRSRVSSTCEYVAPTCKYGEPTVTPGGWVRATSLLPDAASRSGRRRPPPRVPTVVPPIAAAPSRRSPDGVVRGR